jgi:hypothetical protein
MFRLQLDDWSFDKDLQLIHADVTLSVADTIIIEEPLCIDVGLPALMASALYDVEPNRWAPAEEWQRMPFFVCGCGDPDCRAFSFVVHHRDGDKLEFTWVEERQNNSYREMESFSIEGSDYRTEVLKLGRQFLQFVKELDYKPYFTETVPIIKDLTLKLASEFL